MKLFEGVIPAPNPVAKQKIDKKSINKGCGAMALIMAFIAISKA